MLVDGACVRLPLDYFRLAHNFSKGHFIMCIQEETNLKFKRANIYTVYSASTYSANTYCQLNRVQLLGQKKTFWWKYIDIICYQIAHIFRSSALTQLDRFGTLSEYLLHVK